MRFVALSVVVNLLSVVPGLDPAPSGELLWIKDLLHLSFQSAVLTDIRAVEAGITIIVFQMAVEVLNLMPICFENSPVLLAGEVAGSVDSVSL